MLNLEVIVEPICGQMKTSGFRRFNLRGIEKTCGEFSLICVASNYKKIVAKLKIKTNHSLENQIYRN